MNGVPLQTYETYKPTMERLLQKFVVNHQKSYDSVEWIEHIHNNENEDHEHTIMVRFISGGSPIDHMRLIFGEKKQQLLIAATTLDLARDVASVYFYLSENKSFEQISEMMEEVVGKSWSRRTPA